MKISLSTTFQFKGTPATASLAPLKTQSFLIAAMYTPSYAAQAARLETSLRSLGLAFTLFEVPHVHRSISRRGVTDAAFTKSAFIRAMLDRYGLPVLYVDADVVFRSVPERIARVVAAGADFAIYNWLGDEHTDAFKALEVAVPGQQSAIQTARFLRFSHSVDYYDPQQLLCSGATQLYCNTPGARALLEAWARVIEEQPGVADDPCLDCAFNNDLAGIPVLASWLGKDYARYAWWVYVKPIIDHPDPPATGQDFSCFRESPLRPRVHQDRLQIRCDGRLIPRECIIDVENRTLCKIVQGAPLGAPQLVPVGQLERELYFDP